MKRITFGAFFLQCIGAPVTPVSALRSLSVEFIYPVQGAFPVPVGQRRAYTPLRMRRWRLFVGNAGQPYRGLWVAAQCTVKAIFASTSPVCVAAEAVVVCQFLPVFPGLFGFVAGQSPSGMCQDFSDQWCVLFGPSLWIARSRAFVRILPALDPFAVFGRKAFGQVAGEAGFLVGESQADTRPDVFAGDHGAGIELVKGRVAGIGLRVSHQPQCKRILERLLPVAFLQSRTNVVTLQGDRSLRGVKPEIVVPVLAFARVCATSLCAGGWQSAGHGIDPGSFRLRRVLPC